VEDATWEGNDDSHLFPLDNSQAITGAVQAVWQQAKFFQGLTPDLQKVILQTGKDITLFHNNLQNKMESQWKQKLIDKGMTFVVSDQAAFKKRLADIPNKFTAKWAPGLYLEIQKEIREYQAKKAR